MKDLIKRRLIFVEAEQSMVDVVTTMRDQNISSVLVLNRDRLVAGIVTERDIVQKFTLIEKPEKMAVSVAAFMTRPVSFARLSHLEDDVRDMFFQRRLRHFPVSEGSSHESQIIGMLTVTDMTAAYLQSTKTMKVKVILEPLVIIAGNETARTRYKTLFEALKFTVITGVQIDRLMKQASDYKYPIVFDIDDFPIELVKKELAKLKVHKGVFILLSSQQALVDPLKKMLDSDVHFVALKPLDISYILRLLSSLQDSQAEKSGQAS